jgi:hypothetical protein
MTQPQISLPSVGVLQDPAVKAALEEVLQAALALAMAQVALLRQQQLRPCHN